MLIAFILLSTLILQVPYTFTTQGALGVASEEYKDQSNKALLIKAESLSKQLLSLENNTDVVLKELASILVENIKIWQNQIYEHSSKTVSNSADDTCQACNAYATTPTFATFNKCWSATYTYLKNQEKAVDTIE